MKIPSKLARMKNPCEPTCQERTSDCHSTCKRYKIWKIYKDLENIRKRSARNQHECFHDDFQNKYKGRR